MFFVVWFVKTLNSSIFLLLVLSHCRSWKFRKDPGTGEQFDTGQHFEAICNKNTVHCVRAQSSRLTSLCGKFGPSPRDSFEVKNRVFYPRKKRFKKFRQVLR